MLYIGLSPVLVENSKIGTKLLAGEYHFNFHQLTRVASPV